MARLTDGKRSVEVYMGYWVDDHYTPDFSDDFFAVGGLKMDENGFHVVPDVSYCLEQADDWCNGRGDYCCDEDDDPRFDNRVIGIDNNPN